MCTAKEREATRGVSGKDARSRVRRFVLSGLRNNMYSPRRWKILGDGATYRKCGPGVQDAKLASPTSPAGSPVGCGFFLGWNRFRRVAFAASGPGGSQTATGTAGAPRWGKRPCTDYGAVPGTRVGEVRLRVCQVRGATTRRAYTSRLRDVRLVGAKKKEFPLEEVAIARSLFLCFIHRPRHSAGNG